MHGCVCVGEYVCVYVCVRVYVCMCVNVIVSVCSMSISMRIYIRVCDFAYYASAQACAAVGFLCLHNEYNYYV